MSEVIYPRLGCDDVFGPEDIAQLAAGLESALTDLGIKDRNDPTTTLVAKLIIHLAAPPSRRPYVGSFDPRWGPWTEKAPAFKGRGKLSRVDRR